MQSDLNADATHSILEWINKNWHNLGQYCCQYIAYNAKGIIANGKELDIVLKKAKESGEIYAIYFVPRYTGSMIMLPIHLRSVSRHVTVHSPPPLSGTAFRSTWSQSCVRV